MSDQTIKAGDGILDEHYCEHSGCKKWGGFGYSRSKTEMSSWHCWEHYPQRDLFQFDRSARRKDG